LPVKHTGWREIEQLISDVYATPPDVIARAAKIIGGP
jgi:hypothetical protein